MTLDKQRKLKMWQAAIGVAIGYAFALWWVRRDTKKEVAAVREMYAGRLEARDEEIRELRAGFEKSQRAAADLERRSRYLESALGADVQRVVERRTSNGRRTGKESVG